MGTPRALSQDELASARDTKLVVANVLPGTPAALTGLLPGDSIISASDAEGGWQAVDSKKLFGVHRQKRRRPGRTARKKRKR